VLTLLNIASGDRLLVSQTQQFLTALPVEAAPENTASIKWFRCPNANKSNEKDKLDGVQLQMKDVST
jgi:hypothetical protein